MCFARPCTSASDIDGGQAECEVLADRLDLTLALVPTTVQLGGDLAILDGMQNA